jgi:putative heme transporter
MTFALFQAGWHWPLVAAAVFVLCAVLSAIAVGQSEDEWLGARKRSLKRLLWLSAALLVLALFAGQLHKLKGMLLRVQDGDPKWLGFAVGVEALSFLGYIMLAWGIFRREAPRLTLAACVEMTFGGVVATRLFSAGGAGGVAFTAWALRAAGMAARTTLETITVFLAVMYTPYAIACILGGLGGGAPDGVVLTGIGFGVAAFAVAALLTLIPGDIERRARRLAAGHGRVAKIAAKLATVPAVAGDTVRTGLKLVRQRPSLMGWATLWWAADVAVLDACFRAFGQSAALGVLILGYFIGHIGNLLPMPGGVGGVEGGMVGVFVACGMPLSLAIVGTIAYQVISTWLPVVPGLGAYWSLRRRVNRWRAEEGLPPEERGSQTVPGGRTPTTAER